MEDLAFVHWPSGVQEMNRIFSSHPFLCVVFRNRLYDQDLRACLQVGAKEAARDGVLWLSYHGPLAKMIFRGGALCSVKKKTRVMIGPASN